MMNKNYKNIASEKAKEKALIEQAYTCVDDVKKEFKFKNIEDLRSIQKVKQVYKRYLGIFWRVYK